MNEMKVFDSQEFGEVRTVIINGEPWFVGKDVAQALGYENTKDAIAKHVDPEDKIMGAQNTTPSITDSMGRIQYPTWINESGMYALVFGCKLESAKRFKRWVTSEVLPLIRKTGNYLSESDNKMLKLMESYQQFMERQEKFNQIVIDKLINSNHIQVHQIESDMENCSILVDEESEFQRRSEMLNQLVEKMAKSRGWDKTFALHRMYKTLAKVLDVSLDEYLEIYRAETGNVHASTWKIITEYNNLYKTAVRLCINTINSLKC